MKNILIVKVYIAVILLYTLFVVFFLFRFKQARRRKKEVIGKGGIVNSKGNKTDIIGKSKFRNTHLAPSITIPEPLTSISSENEKRMKKPDTFAPSNETKVSAEVPEEELDAIFSDTPPPDEENLPLNIDFPLEYEYDQTNEEEEEKEEEDETEELEGLTGAALASGVRFEDLGNVVWTVSQKGKANATQKKLAGNTLLEIRQTDMFEQLISGKPDAKEIVTLLMEQSLAAFHRRTEHKSNNADSFDKVPDSFDIRDFA